MLNKYEIDVLLDGLQKGTLTLIVPLQQHKTPLQKMLPISTQSTNPSRKKNGLQPLN